MPSEDTSLSWHRMLSHPDVIDDDNGIHGCTEDPVPSQDVAQNGPQTL